MKRAIRAKLLCLIFLVLGFLSFWPQLTSADFFVIPVRTKAMPPVKTIPVNCNAGQTINSALAKANPGDTIQVRGTCNETVSLSSPSHDHLQIDGLNTAIINGGGKDVISISSAQGVAIKGLTVQNGKVGITGESGASFSVENVTVSNSGDIGIQLHDNTVALLKNCTVDKSNDYGILVSQATATFNGNIVTKNNGGHGLFIALGSNAHLSEATVTADYNKRGIFVYNSSSLLISNSTITTNNNERGIQVYNSSSLSAYSTTITSNNNERGILVGNASSLDFGASTITLQNNTRWGLQFSGTSSVYTAPDTTVTILNSDRGFQLHGSSYAEITGTLNVEGSANRGIFVTLNSTIEIGDPADITVRRSAGDGYGIEIVDGSSVNAQGGSLIVEGNDSDGIRATRSSRFRAGASSSTQIRNNGRWGLWAVDGSAVDCSNAIITGNTDGQVRLSFGSRASLYGGTIGSISCDGTVLTRGDYACPR